MVSQDLGIGIGIGAVVGFAVAFMILGINPGSTSAPIENIPVLDFNKKAELLYLDANYDEEVDRLKITMMLTDEDAEYTIDTGILDINVKNDDGRIVFTDQYRVTEDDFYTWKQGGEKVKGALISFDRYFGPYNHDVIIDFTTDDSTFGGATTNFWSFND